MTDIDPSDAGGPAGEDYATPLASIDLNRTPFGGGAFNIDPPDPDNPNLDGGQVLYHMALGAKPEDFHPNLQPIAQGYDLYLQPPPPKTPGLLGSLDDIRAAIASGSSGESGAEADEDPDAADVSPAAVGQRRALPSEHPKTLDPTVERHVAEYNQAHGLTPEDREYLDPDVIKAMIRQEAGHDYDALIRDPMQVNASTKDWDPRKAGLGLKKGVAPGADLSVKAGIEWLRTKAYPHDAQGNETAFVGWPKAVQKYNGHLPDYSDQVWDHLGEIKAGL